MDPRRRFLIAATGLMVVVAVGAAGYMLIERWSFMDAIYMTVITLSTVGFEEVRDLSNGGRVFGTREQLRNLEGSA